ncbi:MAG: zf-HC2 domain-containing protein, partial [Planctomycetota bacterium]
MEPDLDDLRRLHRTVLRQDPYDGEACLGAGLLASYLTGALPPADAAAVRQHLETCQACAQRVAEAQEALGTFERRQADVLDRLLDDLRAAESAAAPTRVPLGDLAARANDSVRRLILTAMEALADALSGSQPALATVRPGYRAAPAGTVEAKVVGAGEGRPDRLTFDVIAAHIDSDGRCVVDLSTADPHLPLVLTDPR